MTLLHNFGQRYDFSGRQRNDNKLKRVNFIGKRGAAAGSLPLTYPFSTINPPLIFQKCGLMTVFLE